MSIDQKEIKTLIEDNQGSPLDALGVGSADSDNMLDDMLAKNTPGRTFGVKGFLNASEAARQTIDQLNQEPSQQPAQVDPDDEPTKEPEKQKPEDMRAPEWMAQNHEQVELRKRQDTFERSLQQQQQQQQAALQRIEQAVREKAAPPEDAFEDWDWADPYQRQAYEQKIEQRVQQQIHAAQAPMLWQIGKQNFDSAIADLSRNEHFNHYYKPEKVDEYAAAIAQRMTPHQFASTNWHYEWTQAFKAMDYDRLAKENSEVKVAKNQAQERETQKKNLALVPKASATGVTSTKRVQSNDEGLPAFGDKSPFARISADFKKKFAT